MIHVDALHINDGGGKILLDYLIRELEKQPQDVEYFLDQRICNNHPKIKSGNIVRYSNASLGSRLHYYSERRKLWGKILCFANVPPLKSVDGIVYTYFHQLLFLQIPSNVSFKNLVMLNAKIQVIRKVKRNTDFWIVQSSLLKNMLVDKFGIDECRVKIIPFYPPINSISEVKRIPKSFLYVSSGEPHKNHKRLLSSFKMHFDKFRLGRLDLTIDSQHNSLISEIRYLNSMGYPIFNHGFINRERLSSLYCASEFSIYPSLAESFGLGIIEAIDCGCKIVGADRPYMHSVCRPSIVFDPESESEMARAMESAVFGNTRASMKLVENEIESLINLLKGN